jgi:hypothetical protein
MKTPIEKLERFLKEYQKQNGGDFPSSEIVYAQISMLKEEFGLFEWGESDTTNEFIHTKEDVMRSFDIGIRIGFMFEESHHEAVKKDMYTKTFENE